MTVSATRWRSSQPWLTEKLKITIELTELLQFIKEWLTVDNKAEASFAQLVGPAAAFR
jgi:hypothetical protein